MKHHHEDCCCCGVAEAINRLTLAVLKVSQPPKDTVRFSVAFGLPKPKKKVPIMLETTVTNEQKVNVVLKPTTQSGKPAKLDGVPTWSVVSGDSTVVPAADGMSADLVSSDTPGDTTFLIDGDADLGAGVVDVQETITLHDSGANAANLGVVIGTPVLK